MNTLRALGVAAAFVAAACAPSDPPAGPVEIGSSPQEIAAPATVAAPDSPGPARKVDPRRDGFEVGFGEYAITLEAPAMRPGRVTFLVHNGGKLVHGFEMEAEGEGEDNSGPGGGGDDEGFKIETESIQPGATLEVELDLAPGLYKVECWVDGHDDLGMEIMLPVEADAPLVREEPAASGDAVSISGFQFDPAELPVAPGTEVTWTNDDPETHTVTADNGSFDSGPMDPGATFAAVVDASGAVTYFCAIHPSMKGTLTVG